MARPLNRITRKKKGVRSAVSLPEDLCLQIDAWRRDQADPPNRAEAIRRLVELGLLKAKPNKFVADE